MQSDVHDRSAPRLIIVGSSPREIRMTEALLARLPANLSAAVLVVLVFRTAQPLRLASGALEQEEVGPSQGVFLKPAHVYVVPAPGAAQVRGRTLRFVGGKGDYVSLFFSAAEAFGKEATAILLSDVGPIGATLAHAVKGAGGTVLMEDSARRRQPLLPPNMVDCVAPVPELGSIAGQLASWSRPRPSHSDLELLIALANGHREEDLNHYERARFEQAVACRMAVNHLHALSAYTDRLREDRRETASLLAAVTQGVSELPFHRPAFELLSKRALPLIIQRGRQRGNRLRLWTAGCGSGAEPYGLAIMLAEALADELERWRITIFATDVNASLIRYARQGLFAKGTLSNLPEVLQRRYFREERGYLRIAHLARRMICFAARDPLRSAPLADLDLVVCRRPLFRLRAEWQHQLLAIFVEATRGGGYLFLEAGDATLMSRSDCEAVSVAWHLYRCRASRAVSAEPMHWQEECSILAEEVAARGELLGRVSWHGAEAPWRPALDLAPGLAMALLDAKGEVVHASQGMELLWPDVPVEGLSWNELGLAEPELFARAVVLGTPQVRHDVRLLYQGKETYWSVSLLRFADAEETKDGASVMLMLRECTSGRLARRALEEKLKLTHAFMSLVSHELRTQLVPLVGYGELLGKIAAIKTTQVEPRWDPLVGQYVAKFQKQLQQLDKLTDDLLDVSRLHTGKFTLAVGKVNLCNTVRLATEQARMSSGADIHLDTSRCRVPMWVLGDEGRLLQVFTNLLNNAVRHAGGQIDVVIEPRLRGRRMREVAVHVRDYGPGIPEEERGWLFTPFAQAAATKRHGGQGLGLGLFISKTIVEQHGGTLLLESKVAQGSTFTVRLPLLGEASSTANAHALHT